MHYESFAPAPSLQNLVKEYWVFENDDPSTHTQKIVPDGYSEIIVHYGDPYQINLSGTWKSQSKMLFSSQISKFFFLQNTGTSGMIGIKLHPTAFYQLFQVDVSSLTDRVVDLNKILSEDLSDLTSVQNQELPIAQRVKLVESWLLKQSTQLFPQAKVNQCITDIFNTHGMIDMEQLASNVDLSTRQLERLFKKVVGLTPKFYCRIIRFNYVFEVMKNQNDSWIRTALQSGYFDQSHFIKNFKEFTGEEPSNYGFDEINLANFFLKK